MSSNQAELDQTELPVSALKSSGYPKLSSIIIGYISLEQQ